MPKTDVENIREWIEKQGYPLEMFAAQILSNLGFDVSQSAYYTDTETGKHREIDVIASVTETINSKYLKFSLVLECKFSREKPWLLFASEKNKISFNDLMRNRAANRPGITVSSKLAGFPELEEYGLLARSARPAYSATQAFTSGKDVTYEACLAAATAAVALVKESNEKQSLSYYPELIFPVVLLDGKLFEIYLDQSNETSVAELSSGVLVWRKPILGLPYTILNIVTRDSFETFAEDAKRSFQALFAKCREYPRILDT
ncbi:MAG TPA: hypothetical protein VKA60_23420 [Blastocatellia bacterium]|nr:hypothetical protein [Blastocatellia bacterium]